MLIMGLERGEGDQQVEMVAYKEGRSEEEINGKELRGERKANGKRDRNGWMLGSRQ